MLVNENEVAHSAFADTLEILRRPGSLGDSKLDSYRFNVFDKYNVRRLFMPEDENHLLGYDSMIVATNACNNQEILDALRANASTIDEFLRQSKGIFLSSQKKLSILVSSSDQRTWRPTGFLPERLDYRIHDRPEASSAAGNISTENPADPLLVYPNHIPCELVEYHCEHNSFMRHRYRSHLVPIYPTQYVPLLVDKTSAPPPEELRTSITPHRALLMRSGTPSERVVISTIAVDWAGHEELLENILVYITEGTDRLAILRKRGHVGDEPMDSYCVRARVAKFAIREYFDQDLKQISELSHCAFVLSPAYSMAEADLIWTTLTAKSHQQIDLYHVAESNASNGESFLQHKTNTSSVDSIAMCAIGWIGREFYPSLWGRSVWTYSYVLPVMTELRLDTTPYLPFIFGDILRHTCRDGEFVGSYDNVINATCALLTVMHHSLMQSVFADSALQSPYASEGTESVTPRDLYSRTTEWVRMKMLDKGEYSLQDRLYMLVTLGTVDCLSSLTLDEAVDAKQIAIETLSAYRRIGFSSSRLIEICQILELICVAATLGWIAQAPAGRDANEVVRAITALQDQDGRWRNTSETAEVCLSLLRVSQRHPSLVPLDSIHEALTRGVEYLLRAYDVAAGNWDADVNATAKSIHAIVLFDQAVGYAATDFVTDIGTRQRRMAHSRMHGQEVTSSGTLLRAIFERDSTNKDLARKIEEAINRRRRLSKAIGAWRMIAFATVVFGLVSLAGLILLGTVLYMQYRAVAYALVAEWNSYLISGFIGIVITLVFSGLYGILKKKILGDE